MPNTKNAIGYPNADGSFGEIANNNPKYDGINAADVSFDNTGTGMSATNVQGAIGEVNSKTEHNADTSSYITIPTDGTEYTVQQPGIFELTVYTSTEQWSSVIVVVNGIRRYGIENRNDKGIGGSFSMNLYPGDVIRINLYYGAGVTLSRMYVIS